MEGVTISGYNKDQLGQQTVTITYEGQTLEVKVTVIPRIAFEGVTKEYFVGDTFDKCYDELTFDEALERYKLVSSEEVAKMAYLSRTLEANPASEDIRKKHYYRKHGAGAYYGQK